ncbi:MAG: phosphotransferase [Acidobacteria bacterium]|nr:phosphotransferase [Acidobacteriota bacterium]
MSDFRTRLEKYLKQRGEPSEIEQLTPDASTREYFRIQRKGRSAIACVYPEPFVESEQSYLDVTRLFLAAGLPVGEILDFDEKLGVIIIEDFGDVILRNVVKGSGEAERDRLFRDAITLIAKIQAATPLAYKMNSIASRLKFDTEKLLWELNFFKEHFFTTYRKKPLEISAEKVLEAEFIELCGDLESRASVLCHRDFHAANLMVSTDGSLRIIDHQDARIGTTSYDLVSLLLDRITEPPSSVWLDEMKRFFLAAREAAGLDVIEFARFSEEFQLQAIQRCLKAVGTFSYQSSYRGKSYFEPFIAPTIKMVADIAANTNRFPATAEILASYSER